MCIPTTGKQELAKLTNKERERLRLEKRNIHIKSFEEIAMADMEMIFPGKKVHLKAVFKIQVGSQRHCLYNFSGFYHLAANKTAMVFVDIGMFYFVVEWAARAVLVFKKKASTLYFIDNKFNFSFFSRFSFLLLFVII